MLVKRNNAKSSIATLLSAGATTLIVSDGNQFPALFPFLITVWDKAIYPDPSNDAGMEILKCTARVGNSLTVVRGQESTVDQAHAISETVEMLLTKGHFDEIEEALGSGLMTSRKDYTLGGVQFTFGVAFATQTPRIAIGLELKNLADNIYPLSAKITSLTAYSVIVKVYKATLVGPDVVFAECATNDVTVHISAIGGIK
jgi:hypothetical protein